MLPGNFLETRAGRAAYVAGLTLVLTGLGFWAAVKIGVPTSTLADAAVTDAPFAKSAELAVLQDLKFAKLAQAKAKSDRVRNFAGQILADQPQVADSLRRTAFKENISLPTSLATRDQAEFERLSMLDGPEFDRAYLRYMASSLTDNLQVFRHEAAAGNDNLVRRFASQTLPVIENHLDEARRELNKVAPPKSKLVNGAGIPMQTPQRR